MKPIFWILAGAVLAVAVYLLLVPAASPEGPESLPAQAALSPQEVAPAPTQAIPEPGETMAETLPAMPEEDPLQTLLEGMTTEEKVGQLFLARCPGDTALEDIATYHLGGYILFGSDFDGQTPERVRDTVSAWQEASPIPLLIAVDEEGGTVCRVSRVSSFRSTPFRSPRDYFAEGGMKAVLAAEVEKAILLKGLGIQVNMGPVCDITTRKDSFMYRRSLGLGPVETAIFVTETVDILNIHQVGSVLKHFPGYGNNTDTHTGIARDSRSLEELEDHDLIPFLAGIRAGCDAILVSHAIAETFDKDTPATLSPAVHRYLREDMGFDGVIVTDDLKMQAITDLYGVEEAAVLAVLAGNDLLCASDYRVQYPAVLEAVQSGRIPMELVDAAVLRILRWKQSLGLL